VFGPSRLCTPLLWPRLTSARASPAPVGATSFEAREQISQGKTRDRRSIYPPHIRRASPDDHGLRVFVPSRPPALRLVCGSYSSGRSFACGFLSTTRRRVAVAVRLGVPVIEVPRGLAPPHHFPIRFRVSVDSASRGAARRAWRTQRKRPRLRARGLSKYPAEPNLSADHLQIGGGNHHLAIFVGVTAIRRNLFDFRLANAQMCHSD